MGLFQKPSANPLFPDQAQLPQQRPEIPALPGEVPVNFQQWQSDPVNLIKIGQDPQQASQFRTAQQQVRPEAPPDVAPQAPNIQVPNSPMPTVASPAPPTFDASGIMPKRPDSPYMHLSGKQTAGMALATALDSIGAALSHGQASVGRNWNENIGNTIQARQAYDQNAPKLQYDLKQQVTRDAAQNAALQAGTAHTQAETRNLGGQLTPEETRKAQFLSQIGSDAESGQYSPEALKARALRMAQFNKVNVLPEEIDSAIGGAQTKPPVFKTNAQGVIEPITYRGKVYGPDATAGEPKEVTDSRAQVMNSLKLATQTQEDKEKRVAGYAADRAAVATQNAMSSADLKKGKELASKHLEDLRAASNQNELVQQLASSKSPTDQTSLAFKALGLDLPDGVHRINETELNAIRNQGSLSDRAYRTILNWKTGEQFAPDILADIAKTANTISASKIKNANQNLDDVERVYGYKAPRPQAATSAQYKVGDVITVKGGKKVKVTAVHPDGSFDAE